jgi:hypothetical protein
MKTRIDLVLIVVAGIITVAVLTAAVSVASYYVPAKPAVYFIPWAFVLVPVVVLIIGALAAREAYYACKGPNQSVLVSTVAALIAAVGGIALWMWAGPATGLQDFIGLYLKSVHISGYDDLPFLLVVYALAGAIGGIVDYFLPRGRKCDINQQRQNNKKREGRFAILMTASFSMLRTSSAVLTSSRTPLPSAYFLALSMTVRTDAGRSLSWADFAAFSPRANEARK